jgi:hypothetical protein
MSPTERFFGDDLANQPSHRLVAIAFGCALAVTMWFDLTRGEILWPGLWGPIRRDERPVAYWVTILMRGGMTLLFLSLGILALPHL